MSFEDDSSEKQVVVVDDDNSDDMTEQSGEFGFEGDGTNVIQSSSSFSFFQSGDSFGGDDLVYEPDVFLTTPDGKKIECSEKLRDDVNNYKKLFGDGSVVVSFVFILHPPFFISFSSLPQFT